MTTRTLRIVCASLGLLLPLALTGVTAQESLKLIRYDDCGAPGRQPHVVQPNSWTFEESRVSGPMSARTVAFDTAAVRICYLGLAPHARYGLRVTYVTERDQARGQTLFANDKPVHDTLALPLGEPKTLDYPLPPDIAAAGTIELSFRRVTGPNAVVSEVWLLSDTPQPELSLELYPAAEGKVTARALDETLQPRAGAAITLGGLPGPELHGTTDARGEATFDLTGHLPPAATPTDLTVTAQSAGLTATRHISADAVIFRRPTLTPIPEAVAGTDSPAITLNGTWRFNPAPQGEWWKPEASDADWKPIQVPGEWEMQGFKVAPNVAAGYRCTFTVPASFRAGWPVLRFDGVFSKCDVWLNGNLVGHHEGGFTPFEIRPRGFDTDGPNVLALAVTSESLADTLASANTYAHRNIGGIPRKVTCFALSPAHLTRFHAQTDLAPDYKAATLVVTGHVLGPSSSRLRLTLTDADGKPVSLGRNEARVADDGSISVRLPVKHPRLWDAEHPNLYRLTGEILDGGKVVERVSRLIGFREVKVQGAQLLINGRPVKLHGTCRHEVDPDRGRSLTPAMWARDIELLKGANVNCVRTSHYPPAEEFIELCDRAGIYVQEEAPLCWVGGGNANAAEALGPILRQTAEMVERDRSHPSVIIWDLANESSWGDNFVRQHEYVRAEDPSRPTLFSGASDADAAHGKPDGTCEIGSWHYPGLGGAATLKDSKRPVTFDEYCHLNCYNVAEVSLDPGLRDYWGHAIQGMWDEMQAAPACLGGSIWCWADDVFDVPKTGRVGYGEWGAVDGWRRTKPEWWHRREAYSPVKVSGDGVKEGVQPIPVQVENRFDFTNLSELRCTWQMGEEKGELRPDIPPRSRGVIFIPAKAIAGSKLELRFYRAQGLSVDRYALPVIPTQVPSPYPPRHGPPPTLAETPDRYALTGRGFTLSLTRATGAVAMTIPPTPTRRGAGGEAHGPFFAASRIGTDQDAALDTSAVPAHDVSAETLADCVLLRWSKDAPFGKVSYSLRAYGDGYLKADYEVRWTGAQVGVREIGLLWQFPTDCRELQWRRLGQWTEYPPDHIGCLEGRTPSPGYINSGLGGGREPWSLDVDKRGFNDFRSTKYNIIEAAVTNRDGTGLRVMSDGRQSVRATVMPDGKVTLRVNDFANGGGEQFLSGQYARDQRTLKPGDVLTGSVLVQLLPAP